jgi:5'-nucleotidase
MGCFLVVLWCVFYYKRIIISVMNRREFINRSAAVGLLLGAGAFPVEAFAAGDLQKITILHTNDQHSRIDPFPMDGTKNQGLGGVARRAEVIRQVRAQEKNVMLLDSGDIFQGTPYFNKYHGQVEIMMMNEMKYDATTIGNHDFDGGLDNLAVRMDQAQFPFLVSNYGINDTPLKNKAKEYKTFKYGDVKVGVFGVCIELHGLVDKNMYGGTIYRDPIADANRVAATLKHDEKCDLVICLSHLGFKYDGNKVSDQVLAKSTRNIDLILGGHTHTFFDAPETYTNAEGRNVLVNQVGWAGIYLGQVDFYFDHKKRKQNNNNSPIKIVPIKG